MLPAHTGRLQGLAFTVWIAPDSQPPAHAGIVILHGAGSAKESHYDFARAAVALGFAAICFDQRGHGESAGPMDGRILEDVVMMAVRLRGVLGDRRAPLALRGSSMGGYLAILAAAPTEAQAVVAICPAGAAALRRGLAARRLSFAADESLDAFLAEHELQPAVASLTAPLLLMHAEGDEQVPIQHSRELASLLSGDRSRLIAVPGGHHRSIQHDAELQAVSLRFLQRALGRRPRPEMR